MLLNLSPGSQSTDVFSFCLLRAHISRIKGPVWPFLQIQLEVALLVVHATTKQVLTTEASLYQANGER